MKKISPTIQYNDLHDVLYIRIKDCLRSFAHEEDYGILINLDMYTKEIVGFDIWDFKYRIEHNEDVPLPICIDLKEIYNALG